MADDGRLFRAAMLWINSGVDPMEVAQRAGHSLTVLFRFYAKIVKGQQSRAGPTDGSYALVSARIQPIQGETG
ncbi:integrase [Streptomyces exfoliatus]|uniref:integrase n=1 Tax=Streptomyces vilmorinianum TaxID=3051092 RepID=UPI0020C82A19